MHYVKKFRRNKTVPPGGMLGFRREESQRRLRNGPIPIDAQASGLHISSLYIFFFVSGTTIVYWYLIKTEDGF